MSAPELDTSVEFWCCLCEKWKPIEEQQGGRDTGPGWYCDDCAVKP